jgi:hypothetical protein
VLLCITDDRQGPTDLNQQNLVSTRFRYLCSGGKCQYTVLILQKVLPAVELVRVLNSHKAPIKEQEVTDHVSATVTG